MQRRTVWLLQAQGPVAPVCWPGGAASGGWLAFTAGTEALSAIVTRAGNEIQFEGCNPDLGEAEVCLVPFPAPPLTSWRQSAGLDSQGGGGGPSMRGVLYKLESLSF